MLKDTPEAVGIEQTGDESFSVDHELGKFEGVCPKGTFPKNIRQGRHAPSTKLLFRGVDFDEKGNIIGR